MTDTYADDYDDDTTETRDPVRAQLKKVERENKELRAKIADAEQATRRLAFVEAGVDISSPTGRLLAKAYDGELTPDAIKAAAVEYGIIAPPPTTTATPTEAAAWKGMTENSVQGSTTAGPVDWVARINAATTQDEVMAILAQQAAAEG